MHSSNNEKYNQIEDKSALKFGRAMICAYTQWLYYMHEYANGDMKQWCKVFILS
jgi:hypothetical protein